MSDKWHQGRMVAFDCETTGVDVFADRIVTAAVVHVTPGERPRSLTWVIDPGCEIPTEASDIHGWTIDRVRAHPKVRQPAQAIYEIAGQVALAMSVGVPLVAFHAAFDLSLLEAECQRHGVDTLTKRLAPKGVRGVVDPFVIDRAKDPYRKGKRVLAAQCTHYGVMLPGAHSADVDALASVRLIGRLVAKYPELARMSLTKLHAEQVVWHRDRQESFANYLRRKGEPTDDVSTEWPLRSAPAREAVS